MKSLTLLIVTAILLFGCVSIPGMGGKGTSTAPTTTTAPTAAQALPSGTPAHLTNCDFSGNWDSDWGTIVLAQSGDRLSGTYTWDSGKLNGTITDGVFVGKWSESPSYSEPDDAGDAVFYFTKDCSSFTGSWQYGVHTSGPWSGSWVGTKK